MDQTAQRPAGSVAVIACGMLSGSSPPCSRGFEFPIATVSVDVLRAHIGCQIIEWLRTQRGVLWSDAVSGILQSGDDMGASASGSPRACSLMAFAMIHSTVAL